MSKRLRFLLSLVIVLGLALPGTALVLLGGRDGGRYVAAAPGSEGNPAIGRDKADARLWALVPEWRGEASGAAAPQGLPEAITLGFDPSIKVMDNRALVEVKVAPGQLTAARSAVASLGGEVSLTYAPADLFSAWVPIVALQALADNASVAHIAAPPIPQKYTVTNEGVSLINAQVWQAAGYTGAGVKVGIVDLGFTGYQQFLGTELPASVIVNGSFYSNQTKGIDGDTNHGTEVAQVLYDVAPGVQLYFVNPDTVTGFLNAVDYLITQGVKVVNHSVGWYGFKGDGSDPLGQKIQAARNAGVTWFNSSGNDALSHWRGTWADSDGDNILEFSGTDETNDFSFPKGVATLVLRWTDSFTAPTNDYQVCLYVVSSGQEFCSGEAQNGISGQTPVDDVSVSNSGSTVTVGARIKRVNAASTNFTFDLWLLHSSASPSFEYPVLAGSIVAPADSPAAVAVGAVQVGDPDHVASYSSQGPTVDARIKPDLAGPSGITVATNTSGGTATVSGTSFSSPIAAGAGALVLQANPSFTPVQLQSVLEGLAVDLGAAGKDNVYGAGRLQLGYSFLRKWGSQGSGDGRFTYPRGIAVDGAGNVYVADGNGYIQKFTNAGQFLAKWASPGSLFAMDGAGNVYVAASNHIEKFTSAGQLLASWGSQGSGDGQFSNPSGVAVDGAGNVFVADTGNSRIQKFTSTGQFLTKWGGDATADVWFYVPTGIAVDSAGNVYVADTRFC